MDHDPSVLFSNLEADLAPHTLRRDGEYIPVSQLDVCTGPRTAAANHLLNSVLKKFKNGTSEMADARAIEKFLHANKMAGEWSLDLQSLGDEQLWGSLRQVWYEFTNGGEFQSTSFHYPKWDLGVGPGSNVGARDCDYYTKVWDSPLACTDEGLYETYRRYVSDWYGPNFLGETVRELSWGHQVVEGCKLICVPKNVDISRVIHKEPTLNMMFQQGLRKQLERRLVDYFGINIQEQQPVNRALASYASTYWWADSETYATIDLESASDTLSVGLLNALSGKNCSLRALLLSFRSPRAEVNGEWVDLNMVGTAGNATTFPFETAIFAAICRAAIRLCGGGWERAHPHAFTSTWDGIKLPSFTVFGDDIIVPTRAVPYVLRLLKICGCKVNSSKSFLQGPFRESCGGDFWKGVNVRGVYVEELDSPQSLCKAYNQLFAWSMRTGIPLVRTLRGLYRALKSKGVGLVPVWEAVDSGLRVSRSALEHFGGLKNPSILRCFSLPSVTKTGVWKYAKYEPVEKLVKALENDLVSPEGSPIRRLNKGGLLDTLLAGHIRGGKWSIRNMDPVFRQKHRVALNWDYPASWEIDRVEVAPPAMGKVIVDPPPFLITYAEAYEMATLEKDTIVDVSDEARIALELRVLNS